MKRTKKLIGALALGLGLAASPFAFSPSSQASTAVADAECRTCCPEDGSLCSWDGGYARNSWDTGQSGSCKDIGIDG